MKPQAAASALYRAALRRPLVTGRPAAHPRPWGRAEATRRLAEALAGPGAVAAVTLATVREDG